MDHILELQEVSKAYRRSDFKLDKVSFRLPYGAIMGFVGENGAGKTTTIDCILNTIRRDEGNILLFGKEMRDGDKELRENIGVVYDGDNFPGYLNPAQLSAIMGGLYKQWDNGLFLDYLKRFHLPEKKKIKTYSRGMTMKLAIAAALAFITAFSSVSLNVSISILPTNLTSCCVACPSSRNWNREAIYDVFCVLGITHINDSYFPQKF